MSGKHFSSQLKNRLPLLKQKIVPAFYPSTAEEQPKPVPPEIQQALIIAFQELMTPTHIGFDYPFLGLGDLSHWYQRIDNCEASSITSVRNLIIKDEFITKLPFVASLTVSKTLLTDAQKQKYDRYHRLIFISSLMLWILDNHDAAITNALRELRLTAEAEEEEEEEEKRKDIFDVLPDPSTFQDVALLRDELNILSKKYSARTPPPIKVIDEKLRRRIRFIYTVIDDALCKSPGKTFSKISAVLPENALRVEIRNESLPTLDDSGDQLSQLHIQPIKDPEAPDWLEEEKQATQADVAIYQYEPAQTVTKDRKLRALQGKRLCEQLASRNLSLPCQFEQLTSWDIRHLVSKLTHDLAATDSNNKAIAATLLCCLLLGQQVQQLIKIRENKPQRLIELKKGRDGQSHLTLHRTHEIPANHPQLTLDIRLPETRQDFYLPLPDHLLNWFHHQPQWCQDEDALKRYLLEINEQQICRLSLGRIARYLTHWGLNNNIDTLYLALLRAEPIHKLPSLSYSQWSISSLLDVWYQYAEALFVEQSVPASLPNRKIFEQKLGSRLYLPDHYLTSLFHLQKGLLRRISSSEPGKFIAYHNQYVSYIWLLLSFVTGHRPVNAPFGVSSDGSLIGKTWWISDKERRAGLAARTLVLPDTAIQQIQLYQAHLRSLKKYFKVLDLSLSTHIQQAIDGEQNMLFLIEETTTVPNQPYQHPPLEITPTRLSEQLKKAMPYPMNWYRHHSRSYLMKLGLSSQLIDCWMGHEELGEEGLGSFSGLSLKDYQFIAVELESLLQQHQIGAIAGCQTR
jgi:hypothetical protein